MRGERECSNCKRLQSEVNSLKTRLARLEAELRRGKRQAAPFSRDARKPNPKKPGRKKGEGTFKYREAPPEEDIETIDVPLDCCPDCGGELQDRQTHEHVQSDLPLPKPSHTRFVTESGYCPRCKKRFRSRHPGQGSSAAGAAGTSVGPNAKAIAADMHHRLGVPYAKIADHLETMSGLRVTPGALCQAGERLALKLEPVYEELICAIRNCCGVHADETGWRIGVLSAWLWVFTSRRITVYVIDRPRGHEVVVEILGREFKGVLHADCFLAYDHKDLSEWVHQKCFSHFLKDLRKMEAEKTRGAVRFPRRVARVLRDALELHKEKPALSQRAFRRRFNKIQRRLDALVNEGRKFTDPDNRRFARRLRKQRENLFTFLTVEGAEPTNNRAERMLRPAVIVRKTGGCNKTRAGAKTHSVNASVLTTARQNGVNVIRYIADVLRASAEPPSLLPVALDST